MIALRGIRFAYPGSSFRLELPDLDIRSHQHTALIGPSGCGKTTLLNLMAGVLLPESGQVTVNGERVNELDDAARRRFRLNQLGLVFQSFELLDYLTVNDNILLPLCIGQGLSLTEGLRQRSCNLAQDLGIGDKLSRYPSELSQGERQRVAVCRSLLLEPQLILADEPTGNLDPANKFLVLDLLLDYAKQSGATVLTVTHDQALLDRFDRVLDFQALNLWQPT
jgi:putative ABC transport system ATP-binding protein